MREGESSQFKQSNSVSLLEERVMSFDYLIRRAEDEGIVFDGITITLADAVSTLSSLLV